MTYSTSIEIVNRGWVCPVCGSGNNPENRICGNLNCREDWSYYSPPIKPHPILPIINPIQPTINPFITLRNSNVSSIEPTLEPTWQGC